MVHPPCGNSTGKGVAVALWLSLYPQLQEGKRDSGAVLASLACPSTALHLPFSAQRQAGWMEQPLERQCFI